MVRLLELTLVHLTVEYCAPVQLNNLHAIKIEYTQLSSVMRVITGSLKANPLPWFTKLSNILPSKARRK